MSELAMTCGLIREASDRCSIVVFSTGPDGPPWADIGLSPEQAKTFKPGHEYRLTIERV